jgi:hypothetical protein
VGTRLLAVVPIPLEPHDRLMFVSDGVLERDAAGADIGAVLAASRDGQCA